LTVTEWRANHATIAARIGREVAGPASGEVDREGRFPAETVAALRHEKMLGGLVPAELGGGGLSLPEVADAIFEIGRYCASSAMILAMHHLQVACLVRHGDNETLRFFLQDVADRQLLLASATTEAGIGGKLRTSSCAVETTPEGFRLEKQAPVISYGAHADAILVTARRGPDSPPNDQVLVVCAPPHLELEAQGDWNTLGFRGTCSPGFILRAEGPREHILPHSFGDISAATMQPVSHALWAHVWLGIASAAASRARRWVQDGARKKPGETPMMAQRLAELMVSYQQMDSLVRAAVQRFQTAADAGRTPGLREAIDYNSLKVGASTTVVQIVAQALAICGMAGYREDGPFSLGRHLRDAHGAALMVNNERMLGDNAQMLLVSKEEL
jgi:acyl-CoA dehydrogenase